MSVFGLRARLKGLLTPAPDPRVRVELVLPDGSEQLLMAQRGETLLRASQRLPVPIFGPCADQRCGECAVVLDSGAQALACTLKLEAPMRVRVPQLWSMEQVRGL